MENSFEDWERDGSTGVRKILHGSPVLKHTGPSLGMATPWEVGMLSRKAALKGGLPGVLALTPL